MSDPVALLALSCSGVIAFSVATAAALKGWYGWLELKRLEMRSQRPSMKSSSPPSRTEVFELKERVRKLEAIAEGSAG